jgi:hypothetical protein
MLAGVTVVQQLEDILGINMRIPFVMTRTSIADKPFTEGRML